MLMEIYLLFILFFVKEITYAIAWSFMAIYTIYVILVYIQAKADANESNEEVTKTLDAIDLLETSTKYKKAMGKPGSVANLEDFIQHRK